jgi:serine phosphatase RsbU (regulator of sigma subunit)
MRFLFTLFIVFSFSPFSHAQYLDSIQKVIDNSANDSIKTYLYMGKVFDYLEEQGDLNKAESYYIKALKHTQNNKRHEILLGVSYAYLLVAQEKHNEAATLLNKLMVMSIEEKFVIGQARCLRTKAISQLFSGNYEKAAELYYDALKKWQETGDLLKIATGFGDLATINYYMDNYKTAAEYWEKSVDIYTIKEKKDNLGSDLGNLGLAYILLKDYYRAEQTIKKAIAINIELNKKKTVASSYSNYAKLEHLRGNLSKAIEYNNKAIDYYQEINDLNQLSRTCCNGAELCRSLKKYDEAINYINKAFEYENLRDQKTNLKDLYFNRAALLSDVGRSKEAYTDILQFMAINDSLKNSDSQKMVAELEKKYELGKKEKENQLLSQQIELKDIESSRQQLAITLIGLILVIVGIVVFILIKQNRTKQRINSQLEEKNHIIQEQHKDITDSIQYSKRIQEAIMPTMHLWEETLPNSFVLYKPKDVLSGDFYWMEKTKDTIYFAACDCTGHGVPGAMVSVICSTALNRAVKEFGIKETGPILDKVRELVLETFEKSEGSVQDGMDISLCGINTKTLELKWSGANNPLWYLQKGEAKEITATKQPIGQVDNPVPFTTHSLQLNKNDIIYLFTDGYADQFGGPKGKKFKYKQLKELILANANKTMREQQDVLTNAFTNWKGNLEQVDDVCIIGVRV